MNRTFFIRNNYWYSTHQRTTACCVIGDDKITVIGSLDEVGWSINEYQPLNVPLSTPFTLMFNWFDGLTSGSIETFTRL